MPVQCSVKSGRRNYRRGLVANNKSFNKLVEMINDKNLIPISEASKKVNEPEDSFYWTWVNNGFIEHKYSGIKIYILKKKLIKVINFKSKYISSIEAVNLAGHHRSYLPNLEKQGLIKHRKKLRNSKYHMKFYDRKEADLFLMLFG